MAPPSLPPRGWYPDPGGSAAWRWWDGERWTDDLEPYATRLQQSALPAFEAEEHAAASFLPLGIGVLVAACLVRALVGSVDLPNTAELVHWAHQVFFAALHHTPRPDSPNLSTPGWISTLSFLVYPLEVVGLVLLFRYQFRAAKAAQAIGLPFSLSPTLGVWGWFIPFANLILPYLAWRDLLPPAHPCRRRMLHLWLVIVGSGVLMVASTLSSAWSIGVARGLILAGLGAQLLALRLAPGVIGAILETHRHATTTRHEGAAGI